MKDILFEDCIEFQNCFLFDGKFSPFEQVEDFLTYYPRVLIGEIGGLFNISCKSVRSVNIYDDEIEDECADIFIYLLLFGRMLEIHAQKCVLGLIAKHWSDPVPDDLKTEEDYYNQCKNMIEKVIFFLNPDREHYYSEHHFYDIFSAIRQISNFKIKLSWQQVINTFHGYVIQKHTNPNLFTLDGLYRGSSRVNIGALLQFVDKIEMKLPAKRVDFLRRMENIQFELWP